MVGIINSHRVMSSLQGLPIQEIISEIIAGVQKGVDRFYRGHTDAQFAGYVRKIIRNKRADYIRKKLSKKNVHESQNECPSATNDTPTQEPLDREDVLELNSEESAGIGSTDVTTAGEMPGTKGTSEGKGNQFPISKITITDTDNLPDMKQWEDANKIGECDINNFLETLKKAVSQGKITAKDINLIQTVYDGYKSGLNEKKELAIKMGIKPNTLTNNLIRLGKKLYKKGITFDP